MKNSEKKKNILKEIRNSGISRKEMAEKLAVSLATINRWIKELGLGKLEKQIDDLSRKKFGKYLVIEFVRRGRYKTGGTFDFWKCQCDCGNICIVRSCNLKSGRSTKCKKCAYGFLKAKKECPIDYNVWYRIQTRCAERGIELSVTPEYLLKIFKKQNGICALSGEKIWFGETRTEETTASPDRIDTSKGYVPGNVRWVHKDVNFMRRNMSDQQLIEWCRKVIVYNS